jgi:diguanylate cyclase (GGDEF)-like protein
MAYRNRQSQRVASLHVQLANAERRAAAAERQVEIAWRHARTDWLTEIPNREGFDFAAADLWRGTTGPVVCLLGDVDSFDEINNRHGHPAGDLVLRTTAETLADTLASHGVVGRLGGDEFAAILAVAGDCDPTAWATRLAWLARSRITEANRAAWAASAYGEQQVSAPAVHMTIGIAAGDTGFHGVADLLARADAAMYHARSHRVAVSSYPVSARTPGHASRSFMRRRDQRPAGDTDTLSPAAAEQWPYRSEAA